MNIEYPSNATDYAGQQTSQHFPSQTKSEENDDQHKPTSADFLGFNVHFGDQLEPQQTSGSRARAKRWTPEEDQKLRDAITQHGTTNWQAVATMVGNGRARSQCSHRWNRVLNPEISKANWSKEEEQILIKSVEQYGNKAWTRVAQQLGNRTDVQCRFKYRYLMKKFDQANALAAQEQPQQMPKETDTV